MIEDEIAALEDEKTELENLFVSPDITSDDMKIKTVRYDSVIQAIEEKYNRWEYLESQNR